MGDSVDMKTLPSIEKMRNQKGSKEGEVKIFKNGNNAEAYCWKDGRWEKIGDVMNPTAGLEAKVYEGDRMFPAGEYDNIFDVDLGDGIMRKLPFDNGSNPLIAADKFILRESLHKAYCEQIQTFIKQNAISYATSDNALKTGEGMTPVEKAQAKANTVVASALPMKKMLFFDAISVDGPKKKILEFN